MALFSATMPRQIRALAKRYLHDPVDIATPEATTSTATVRQRWIQVTQHAKLDALTRVLEVESGDGMIVFVRTKQATEALAEKLRSRGFAASAINGDLVQAQRERTIGALRSGALDLLVATDVAARGLDVDRITHVVNYDIPHDPEAYVHRVGRTGRAGRTGEAILFVTPRERRLLSAIEKVSGRPVEEMSVPSVDEVNARRAVRFAQAITDSMGSPQFHTFRELVEDYARDHDVAMPDVAAALAVMSTTDKQFFLSPDPPKAARVDRPLRPTTARGQVRPRHLDGLRPVPDRRRQAAQDRPLVDRRRPGQRGRPAPVRLRQDHDRRGALDRRAAARPARRRPRRPGQHPHLRASASTSARTPARRPAAVKPHAAAQRGKPPRSRGRRSTADVRPA